MTNLILTRKFLFGISSYQLLLVSTLLLSSLSFTFASPCVPTTGCLSGNAFEDYNFDGIEDPIEPGVQGIEVHIYDDSNTLVNNITTDVNGDWQLCGLTDGDAFRIEFHIPSTLNWLQPTQNGSDNGTDVQFITAPDCADFSIGNSDNFCQDNPYLGVACYGNGDPTVPANGALEAFVSMPYDATSPNSTTHTPPPLKQAIVEDIGTVWGSAYQPSSSTMFASAVMRRFAGFGPLGTGGIYKFDFSDPTTGLPGTHPYNYIDVNTIGISTGADTRDPNDPCNALALNPTDPSHDIDAYDAVGTVGIGDIDYDPHNNTLWLINLNDASLYGIENIDPTTTPVASDVVGGIAVPLPAGYTCDGQIRPWAVKYHKGLVYVGSVCDSYLDQSGGSLMGFVLSIDPNNLGGGFTLVTEVDIIANPQGGYGPTGTSTWRAWRFIWAGNPAYPTQSPILTNIEFDDDDSMIVGVMDRKGLQAGHQNYNVPVCTNTDISDFTSYGDIMRMCYVGGTYILDSDAGCTTSPNPVAIPGAPEYYWGEHGPVSGTSVDFNEISLGGLALLPNSDEVLGTVFDPVAFHSAGLMTLDNTTGGDVNRYQVYNSDNGPAPTFGKTVGLGEPELICNPAPLEIGNYVWIDLNGNGMQDAHEMGVDNLIIQLYDAAGTLIGQDTTVNGNYFFNQYNVDVTGITVDGAGIATPNNNFNLIGYNEQYFIVFGDSQYANGDFVIGGDTFVSTTTFDVNGNANNNIDSDVDETNLTSGSLGARPDGLPFIDVTTSSQAFTAHQFDMGIIPFVPLSIGNYIWVDEDGDGDQDAGEVGIPGVPVNLYDENSVLIATTYTDFNGGYIFDNLPQGTYTVEVDDTQLPAGLQNQTYDVDGVLDHTTVVTLTDDDLAVDFGYNYAPPADTNNPAGATGAIGDRIWNDANGDGIQDPGESGIGSVTVNLLDDTGAVIGTTTTDAAGNYVFDNLAAGVYSVEIDDTTLPTGFTPNPTGDPDSDGDNTSEEIILAPGDVYLDMDFGYNNPTGNDIGDIVFVDVNGNGNFNAGELPISGVTVALIDDANGNGIWDAGELPIATTTTDATGNYLFAGLPDDDYVVLVTDTDNILSGMTNSADPDGGNNAYSGVTLAGADDLTQDFGYVPEGHTATDGIIGNFVFLDADGNNAYTAGEQGIEDVKVELFDNTNTLIATKYTDPNGMYLFGGLPAGTYTVKVDETSLPGSGSIPVGLNASVDPDGGNDNESTTTIATGGQDLLQDFGYKALTPNTITGTIWEDVDANGTLDETTPNLFENVTVVLSDNQGNIIATTTTDANGDFTFIGLPDGTYIVDVTDDNEVLSDYWKSNGPNPGINNNSQNETNSVWVSGGKTDVTSDFGYYTAGASLGNYVWEDTNLDGIQDAVEPALQGVVVTLEITYPDGTVITTTDVTDANGYYSFDNLLLDEDYNTGGGGAMPAYEISATAPSNYIATIVDVNSNGNDLEDSEDPAGTAAIPTQGQENVVANGDPNLETPIASYDFGFGLQATYNIGNYVWLDEDGDGDQDAGEIGIGGVPVSLEDNTGTVIATTITDFNGGYLFEDLPTGTYTVVVDDTKLPAGLQNQTFDKDGVLDNESSVTLSTQDDLSQDFGYNYAPPSDTNNPTSSLGALGDRVWSDANGDGVQDPQEVGVGGVTVNLLDDAGTVIGTTTTDDSGYYIFDNLASGVYAIEIDDSTLPARFNTTPTGDPDGDMTNISELIPLAPGDVHMNMDFGYNDPSAYNLGDRIYLDANVSGAEDAGELPIPNVTVALVADTNGNGMWDVGELPIATDITDSNGNYMFTGLGNGDYVVVVTNSNNVLSDMANTADPDGGLDDYSGVTIAGADDLTQDFGYAPEGHTATDGLIGDLIFLDADRNGTYSAGDSGLEGIGVILYNNEGVFIGSTTTDINGNYLFGGLPADTYTVEVGSASIPVGLTNNVDPDGGNDDTSQTTIGVGGQDLDQDFGYEAAIPNTISGTLWEDRDAVGDLNEPSTVYFEEVTIVLKDANGNVIATTTTDSNGDYSFTGLPDGTYTIEVTDDNNILNGHWLSDGVNDGANDNSQVNNYTVSVSGGSTDETGDFGYYIDGASLGNFVWDDANEDGIQDPGESGIPGVVVTLVIDYPDGTSLTLTETTDANGFYSFDNLLLDEDYNTGGGGTMPSYTLSAATPTGYQTTIVDANSNSNDGADSEDPAGASGIPTQGLDDTSSNTTPTNEAVIAYYDFGFSPIPLPVTLIRFTALANKCNAELSWQSEVETDFSHYVVERARDEGLTFEYVSKVEAKQTEGVKSYEYEDVYVTGKVFYRLKMLNLDGTYSYSNVVSIATDCENDVTGIQLFPNPIGTASTTLNMNFISKAESLGWIIISDNLGKEQLKFPASMMEGENVVGIDVSNLTAGSYIISILSENGKVTSKQFVKLTD